MQSPYGRATQIDGKSSSGSDRDGRPKPAVKTLVIRNGTLIDGSGKPASRNDAIVIEGNKIKHVGALPPDVALKDHGTGRHLTWVIKDRRVVDLEPREDMLTFQQAAE